MDSDITHEGSKSSPTDEKSKIIVVFKISGKRPKDWDEPELKHSTWTCFAIDVHLDAYTILLKVKKPLQNWERIWEWICNEYKDDSFDALRNIEFKDASYIENMALGLKRDLALEQHDAIQLLKEAYRGIYNREISKIGRTAELKRNIPESAIQAKSEVWNLNGNENRFSENFEKQAGSSSKHMGAYKQKEMTFSTASDVSGTSLSYDGLQKAGVQSVESLYGLREGVVTEQEEFPGNSTNTKAVDLEHIANSICTPKDTHKQRNVSNEKLETSSEENNAELISTHLFLSANHGDQESGILYNKQSVDCNDDNVCSGIYTEELNNNLKPYNNEVSDKKEITEGSKALDSLYEDDSTGEYSAQPSAVQKVRDFLEESASRLSVGSKPVRFIGTDANDFQKMLLNPNDLHKQLLPSTQFSPQPTHSHSHSHSPTDAFYQFQDSKDSSRVGLAGIKTTVVTRTASPEVHDEHEQVIESAPGSQFNSEVGTQSSADLSHSKHSSVNVDSADNHRFLTTVSSSNRFSGDPSRGS
ncbi:hypothetical protein AX774_g2667 [Zancudomyces culisetae]|uniref:Uncharacterized protein n=1 Tax=Zancudomyces culisetae TaxID=1213189 RepID=A0A1R1PS72_ZANCU|nr:hypothetical protein AX774_g2667 [Zancudomyces culisetae]|eukprot:OMH83817.1 hypothetical protein AX774_g2667 [Zancudomyces culisetae]